MRRVATALALIALAAATALASVDTGNSHSLAAAQTTNDYDDDDDRLIDVRTLAQLNAIRWDNNGNGSADSATNSGSYAAAFPSPMSNMGCPSAATGNACRGYELRADLDFDTDGDGDVDSGDSPSFPNWRPLGAPFTAPYRSEFKGNNRTISNLTMTGNSSLYRLGLFGTLHSDGIITGVGLVDVNINIPSGSTPSGGTARVGALVGYKEGTVRSSYSTGSVSVASRALIFHLGGLVGTNQAGPIAASWSSAAVSLSGTNLYAGGLVGSLNAGSVAASYATGPVSASSSTTFVWAGGLLGGISNLSTISVSSSYALGAVSASGVGANTIAAGLIAETHAADAFSVSASYWDVGTTGIADDADSASPEGIATSDLQSITSYTGIFANWNANIDGQTGVDDPWEFGQAMQYPRLKFGSMNQVAQGSLVMGTPGTNNDNPVVGQTARVCLLAGPTQRAAGTGGATYQPWQWYRSTDGASWGSPITKSGPTYDYTPVAGDVGNYLRACVDVRSNLNVDRVLGDDRVCVGPFAKVQSN